MNISMQILRLSSLILIFASNSFIGATLAEDAQWRIQAAALYWNANEQGLAYTNKPSDVLSTDDFTLTPTTRPSFQWSWGFKVGAAYSWCCPWSFHASWIHIKSKANGHKSFNSEAPDFLGSFPIWSMGPDTLSSDYVSTSSMHWHQRTNILDLNVQYQFQCFSDHLVILPFLGLRGAALHQNLKATYEGGTFFSGQDVNTLSSRFCGLGPRFGINAGYDLKCGFDIVGRAAIAPLFGRFHLKQRETYLETVRFRRSSSPDRMVLSTDYLIGLRWTGTVGDCLPCISFEVAWEGQQFFSANRFNKGQFHFFSKQRALFLQGLTLQGSIDF